MAARGTELDTTQASAVTGFLLRYKNHTVMTMAGTTMANKGRDKYLRVGKI